MLGSDTPFAERDATCTSITRTKASAAAIIWLQLYASAQITG